MTSTVGCSSIYPELIIPKNAKEFSDGIGN
jgi:hypothetical protein